MLNEDKIGYVKEVLKPYGENDMGRKTKKNSRSEGSICEQFVYLIKLAVYPNSSDMNELSEIRLGGLKERLLNKSNISHYRGV